MGKYTDKVEPGSICKGIHILGEPAQVFFWCFGALFLGGLYLTIGGPL